jgi:AcrR family transcriptional regulator
MPVEPLTRERRRALTRDHLLAAAAEVFARRGYHRTTLDEIAEAAGFSKGAVYSNFAGKDDLFLALMRQRGQQLVSEFAAAAASAEDSAETVAALRAVYSAAEDRRDAWALWTEFTLYAVRNADVLEEMVAASRATQGLVVDLVERQLEQAGIVPPLHADQIARIYTALFVGLWQQQAIDPEAVDDDLFAAAVVFVRQAVEAMGTPREELD